MHIVRTLAELEALYGEPVPSSLTKEIDHLTPLHQEYVSASPFVLIAPPRAARIEATYQEHAKILRAVIQRCTMAALSPLVA